MDAATTIFKHHALMVLLFKQRKTLPIGPQTRVFFQKLIFAHFQEGRDSRDILILDPDISRPFATGVAALTNIVDSRLKNGLIVRRAAV